MTVLVLAAMEIASAKSKEIVSLAITPPTSGGLCPGEQHALEVVATDSAGKTRKVKLGRKEEFGVSWELGPVGPNGQLEMPLDPRAAWGKEGLVTVTLAADPTRKAELGVPLRFDCSVTVDFSGDEGDVGTNGEDGPDTKPNGTDGRAGQPGETGAVGPEVHVRVTRVTEPRTQTPVLQAEIQRLGDDEVRWVAFSPTAGELVVMANGGAGGIGGRGGDGGDGEPGDEKGVGGGSGGNGGTGGNGGLGGNGGSVTVFVDASAQGQVKRIVIENGGGPGGQPGGGGSVGVGGMNNAGKPGRMGIEGNPGAAGPAPEVQAAVVAPLW